MKLFATILLQGSKAVHHPAVEERPLGCHSERPDIRAQGRSGGTELFVVTICLALSQERIWDVVGNLLSMLKAAGSAKFSRYAGMLEAGGTEFKLLPVPLSTLSGWHPEAHRALCSVRTSSAGRGCLHFLALDASCSSAKRL